MTNLEKEFFNGNLAIRVTTREQNNSILEYIKKHNINISAVNQITNLKYQYFYIEMHDNKKFIDSCRSKEYAIQCGYRVVEFEDIFNR